MIKAVAKGPGGMPLLILGFTRKNTELMLNGQVMTIELMGLLGIRATLMVSAGETEGAIILKLAPLCTPETTFEKEDKPSNPKGH